MTDETTTDEAAGERWGELLNEFSDEYGGQRLYALVKQTAVAVDAHVEEHALNDGRGTSADDFKIDDDLF